MIPPITHPSWSRLITGELHLRSTNTGINMLIFNSTVRYKRDPSPAAMLELVKHAHEFFRKFEYCLKDEVKQLIP